jgi:hypothetical protein
MNLRNIFLSCLLIGTAIRIPISETATISLSEILLALALMFFPFYLRGGAIKLSKFEIKLLPLGFVVLSLLAIESLINFHRIASIFLLFEYLFIGILFLLIFKMDFNHRIYYKALITFSLYLAINTIYFNVLNYEAGHISNILKFGSGNYTSAIMLLMIPIIYLYIRENVVPKLNSLAYLSVVLMTIGIIFSGSRSNIVVLLFQIFVYTFLLKNSIAKRAKIIIAVMLISIIVYSVVLFINPELSFVIERYLMFFTKNSNERNDILYSDIIRKHLIMEARELISENKFWGTGFPRLPHSDIPIHNFVYEIILGIGYIGFTVYALYLLFFLGGIFKRISRVNSIRLLYFVMIVSFLSISWVHPFMTTGKEFTWIFWISVVAFYNYSLQFENSKNSKLTQKIVFSHIR